MIKSIIMVLINFSTFYFSVAGELNNTLVAPNKNHYFIKFFAAASQFDLWGEDYRTGTYNAFIEKISLRNWHFSLRYTLAQNIRIYPINFSKDGIIYQRYYSHDHFFGFKTGKDWKYCGVHLGLLGYVLGADYWGRGADTIPFPLPVVKLRIGKINTLFLSLDTFDNIEFGKYYYDTSPVSVGLGCQPNVTSFLYLGIVGFKSEAGATLKSNFLISRKVKMDIQNIYHFREKIFGTGLGLSYQFK